MCGRFVSSSTPDEIANYFGVDQMFEATEAPVEPNFNVAPSQSVLVVRERADQADRPEPGEAAEAVRRLDALRWGLVPFWAKDLRVGNKMINARSETLATKNAFKKSFARRRCIVPVDGFYEWAAVPGQKKKQPYFIHRPDGDPYAFAGLWEIWRGPDRDGSEEVHSCTIITGAPNETMATIHDRMPVMLPPDAWDEWLDPTNDDIDDLSRHFAPAPSELIELRPVSTAVNSARNNVPELIERVEPEVGAPADATLFDGDGGGAP